MTPPNKIKGTIHFLIEQQTIIILVINIMKLKYDKEIDELNFYAERSEAQIFFGKNTDKWSILSSMNSLYNNNKNI